MTRKRTAVQRILHIGSVPNLSLFPSGQNLWSIAKRWAGTASNADGGRRLARARSPVASQPAPAGRPQRPSGPRILATEDPRCVLVDGGEQERMSADFALLDEGILTSSPTRQAGPGRARREMAGTVNLCYAEIT